MVASTTVKCFETQQCATHPPQRDPPSPPPLASTDFGSHFRSPSRPSAASRTLCECVMCSCVSCARQQVPQRTSSSSLTSSSRAMCLVCGDASASDELCVVRRRCDSGKLLREITEIS